MERVVLLERSAVRYARGECLGGSVKCFSVWAGEARRDLDRREQRKEHRGQYVGASPALRLTVAIHSETFGLDWLGCIPPQSLDILLQLTVCTTSTNPRYAEH